MCAEDLHVATVDNRAKGGKCRKKKVSAESPQLASGRASSSTTLGVMFAPFSEQGDRLTFSFAKKLSIQPIQAHNLRHTRTFDNQTRAQQTFMPSLGEDCVVGQLSCLSYS